MTSKLTDQGVIELKIRPISVFWRLMVWLSILKNVRGTNLKMQIGLFISAIIGILLFMIGSSDATLPKMYFPGIVYLKPYGVYFKVRALSDDVYSVMPGREWDVNELILTSLKLGDVFIDVGANIGYYTILGGKIVGETGRVISVEPNQDTVKILNLNFKLNQLKNVVVLPKAAWNRNEILNIQVPKGYFGMVAIKEPDKTTEMLKVQGFTLDELDLPKVDFLKIDAEGSEYPILQGAIRTLDRTHYLVLEASNQKDEIIDLLKEKHFKIRKLQFTTYLFAQREPSV